MSWIQWLAWKRAWRHGVAIGSPINYTDWASGAFPSWLSSYPTDRPAWGFDLPGITATSTGGTELAATVNCNDLEGVGNYRVKVNVSYVNYNFGFVYKFGENGWYNIVSRDGFTMLLGNGAEITRVTTAGIVRGGPVFTIEYEINDTGLFRSRWVQQGGSLPSSWQFSYTDTAKPAATEPGRLTYFTCYADAFLTGSLTMKDIEIEI